MLRFLFACSSLSLLKVVGSETLHYQPLTVNGELAESEKSVKEKIHLKLNSSCCFSFSLKVLMVTSVTESLPPTTQYHNKTTLSLLVKKFKKKSFLSSNHLAIIDNLINSKDDKIEWYKQIA